MRLSFACSLVILLAPAAPADEWNKSYKVTGRPDLRVVADDASIEVRPGQSGAIAARVLTEGWKIGPGDVRVIESQTRDRVDLEVRTPNRYFSFGNRWVRLMLEVPPELAADIRTGDGNIHVAGARGGLRLSTGDGRIEAGQLDGSLQAHTGDGSIQVRGRFEMLDLRTGDGSIVAEVEPGSKMAAPWRVQTGDGSVSVRIPDGFSAAIEAQTGDGHIDVDVPATVAGRISESRFQGKLGEGGHLLRVQTNDGSIRLERR
jgi:hypothetical protein